MNIINKLTLRYLKNNKNRTLFTILSIALSVTMINAVGISLDTILQFYTDSVVVSRGSFHYRYTSNDSLFFEMIENDKSIKDYYYTNTVGYTVLENQNYISLKRGDSLYYEKRNIDDLLLKGNLPLKSDEIILGKDYYHLNIGDKISLKNMDTNHNHTFTIVGFIKDYQTTSSYDRSFNALSYVDLTDGDYYSISIEDKDFSENIFQHTRKTIQEYQNQTGNSVNLTFNSAYLGASQIFEEGTSSTFLVMFGLVGIILVIIIIASVFIIYQAFNLSTHDKVKYLGMLSSVGATPKQKRNSVFFEGFILTLIALPLGILCSYLGMFITFRYLNTLELIKEMRALFHTTISLKFLALTIILTIITLFLSLIKPALYLSRISVIDALRKNDEIKVKKNKLKVGFLTRRLARYDQQLAIKNYKRQGKRSRVIVFSLVLSMVLFVSIYSFSKAMYSEVIDGRYNPLCDLMMVVNGDKEEVDKFKDLLKHNSKVDDYYSFSRDYHLNAYITLDNKQIETSSALYVVDDEIYKKICKDNNVEYKGKNQALMSKVFHSKDVYDLSKEKDFLDKLEYIDFVDGKDVVKDINHFDYIDFISQDNYGLLGNWVNYIEIIVPMSYYDSLDLNSRSNLTFCIESSLYNELYEELLELGYNGTNVTQNNLSDIQSIQVFQIFIYGFICLMILFTLINIVNMMSASIDKRQKELAMLVSVGMSHKAIRKMIFNESLIYGLKTFLYAFPICVLVEYIIYDVMNNGDSVFSISYFAYILSFVVVMIVMYLTFKVGLRKFNNQNIIETLKDDI